MMYYAHKEALEQINWDRRTISSHSGVYLRRHLSDAWACCMRYGKRGSHRFDNRRLSMLHRFLYSGNTPEGAQP